MDFDIIKATLLALIQGLTEFLPISSSAHLIFPSSLLGWEDQGLAFDVAVHLGSLLAVIVYFRRQVLSLLLAWCRNIAGAPPSSDSRLAWQLLAATLPVVIAGLLFKEVVEESFRNVTVIAFTTVIFALLLLYADRKETNTLTLKDLDWKSCMIIGFAQVLALIPGTSRSGITMTAALLCHQGRESASRFSFLLSIPVITGASVLLLLDLLEASSVNWMELWYGLVLTAVVAFLCIHYFLKTITAIGFFPFVVYRLVLGAVLFILFVPGP